MDDGISPNIEGHEYSCSSEHDRLLPIANVGRIMKQILPGNAKISKEAKETMQECVSEFISFVTGEASDKCRKEKRKTLNGDDVCWALGSLGFDNYAPPLNRYLHRYREAERERADEHKAAGNNVGRKALAEEPPAADDDDDDNYFRGEPAIIKYSSSSTTCHNSFQFHQFH